METRSRLSAAAPPPRVASPERADALLALIEAVARDRLGEAEAERFIGALADSLRARADHVLTGVNPQRSDADQAWDRDRAAVYGETVGAGAVHLELGTWTAFPDRRTQELIDADRLAEFIRLDLNPDYRPDVVADVTALPFRGGSIDRVASNSLVEHVAYPQRVVEEMFRVLRPGGVMVVVMPFVWPLHGYPDDYVRLTPRWFERVCRQVGFSDVTAEVASSGGTYNVLHNASKMAAVDAGRPDAAALRELHELTVMLLAALVPLDHGFIGGLELWFHSVRCFARKPGAYQPSGRERKSGVPFVERALELLADPLTGAPLELEGGSLVCRDYGHVYEVRAGIPIFTEPRRVSPRRGPLEAGREQVEAWVRQRVPPDRRDRIPGWLRKAGARALRG